MKKIKVKILLGFFFATTVAFSQVGIGNTDPKATLDVTATYPTGTANPGTIDGITFPSVTRERAQSMTGASISASTMIYINEVTTGTATGTTANVTAIGPYYWDGAIWQPVKSTIIAAKTTTINVSMAALNFANNVGGNIGPAASGFAFAPWTTASAVQKRALSSNTPGIYLSSTTSATTLTNISLNGWLSNTGGSSASATIYIVKYSLGATASVYTNTVTGTTLGTPLTLTVASGNVAPVNITITSTTNLVAGDVIVCVLTNNSGGTRTYEFSGQLTTIAQ